MRITEERRASDKARWMKSFNRLKEWYEKHHRLPRKSENETLYSWYIHQRSDRRIIHLDIDQKHLLESIGLSMKKKRLTFDQCVERYKKDPNHIYSKHWRHRMISRYKKGTLSDEQIKKIRKVLDLDAPLSNENMAGFNSVNRRTHNEAFEQNVAHFMLYLECRGTPLMGYAEKKKANNFRSHMRYMYKKGRLSQEKIEILQSLNIIK